jgi:hypothetical protein
MITKKCSKCGVVKPTDSFPIAKRYRYERHSYCKECTAEMHRESYKMNPSKFKDSVKRWESKNPEKRKAHSAINRALRLGKIIRPRVCEICKMEKPDIVAHHWHGYDEEHYLDVQWMCHQCHKDIDLIKQAA